MVELQPFRLMDGDETNAGNLIALNGLGAEGFIPFTEKTNKRNRGIRDRYRMLWGIRGDSRREVRVIEGFLEEGGELIEEGTDICTLSFESFKTEDGKEVFRQFIERHRAQFLKMLNIGFRQKTVKGLLVEKEQIIIHLVLQDLSLVKFDDGSLCQQVLRTREEAQGLDEQTYGRGGIQAKGLVRDDAHLRQILQEMLGNDRNPCILTDENGNLMGLDIFLQEIAYPLCELQQCLFYIILL